MCRSFTSHPYPLSETSTLNGPGLVCLGQYSARYLSSQSLFSKATWCRTFASRKAPRPILQGCGRTVVGARPSPVLGPESSRGVRHVRRGQLPASHGRGTLGLISRGPRRTALTAPITARFRWPPTSLVARAHVSLTPSFGGIEVYDSVSPLRCMSLLRCGSDITSSPV